MIAWVRSLLAPRHPMLRYADAMRALKAARTSKNPHLVRRAMREVNRTRLAAMRGGA